MKETIAFYDSIRFVQASRARLFKEYKEVQREKVADPDIQLVCDDSNIFKWTALIKVSSVLTSKSWCIKYLDLIRSYVYRDHQRLRLRVAYSSLLLQCLSSIRCNLHKWGSWQKFSIQTCISRYKNCLWYSSICLNMNYRLSSCVDLMWGIICWSQVWKCGKNSKINKVWKVGTEWIYQRWFFRGCHWQQFIGLKFLGSLNYHFIQLWTWTTRSFFVLLFLPNWKNPQIYGHITFFFFWVGGAHYCQLLEIHNESVETYWFF